MRLFSGEDWILLLLFPVLLILFLQIDLVTLLYEKGILVRKWKLFSRDCGRLCDFIPFCEHGCARRLERGVIFARQHHDWRKTGKRGIKKTSLHQPVPHQDNNVNLFFTVASLRDLRYPSRMVVNSRELNSSKFLSFEPKRLPVLKVYVWCNHFWVSVIEPCFG